MAGLYQQYLWKLNDAHYDAGVDNPFSLQSIDFKIREAIGKTDKLDVALCSHAKILEREFPDDELRCRQCGIKLTTGFGRFNDYLVLRHPHCTRPICVDCAKNRPDVFYDAFRKGIDRLEKEGGLFKNIEIEMETFRKNHSKKG